MRFLAATALALALAGCAQPQPGRFELIGDDGDALVLIFDTATGRVYWTELPSHPDDEKPDDEHDI